MNMSQSELRTLADHMGHDLNIHVNHYALQTELMERSKVAKVLTALFHGNLATPSDSVDLNTLAVNDNTLYGQGLLKMYFIAYIS